MQFSDTECHLSQVFLRCIFHDIITETLEEMLNTSEKQLKNDLIFKIYDFCRVH